MGSNPRDPRFLRLTGFAIATLCLGCKTHTLTASAEPEARLQPPVQGSEVDEFAYAVQPGFGTNSGKVLQFKISPDGVMQELKPVVAAVTDKIDWLQFDPNKRFAYGVNKNTIVPFHITASGVLDRVPGLPIIASGLESGPAFSPDGHYAYVVCSKPSRILAYRVGKTGELTRLSPAGYHLMQGRWYINIIPTRNILLAFRFPYHLPSCCQSFRIRKDGTLQAGKTLVSLAGEFPCFDLTGHDAYVPESADADAPPARQERLVQIIRYRVAQTGDLIPYGARLVLPGNPEVTNLHCNPNGRSLCAAVDSHNGAIQPFQISVGGDLVPRRPVLLGNYIRSDEIFYDGEGRYLYSLDHDDSGPSAQWSGSLSAYRVMANGALRPLKGGSLALGWWPTVSIDTTGRFFYIEKQTGRWGTNENWDAIFSIFQYRIQPDGSLKPLSVLPIELGHSVNFSFVRRVRQVSLPAMQRPIHHK